MGLDRAELKRAGLKATFPRIRILELLEHDQNQHHSAESIYKTLLELGEEISLATIYRVLTQFETAKIVCRHRFEDGRAIYELNNGEHHDHIVCMKCGRVEEFVDELIEKRQREITLKAGFEMTDHNLTIYGICCSCKSS